MAVVSERNRFVSQHRQTQINDLFNCLGLSSVSWSLNIIITCSWLTLIVSIPGSCATNRIDGCNLILFDGGRQCFPPPPPSRKRETKRGRAPIEWPEVANDVTDSDHKKASWQESKCSREALERRHGHRSLSSNVSL